MSCSDGESNDLTANGDGEPNEILGQEVNCVLCLEFVGNLDINFFIDGLSVFIVFSGTVLLDINELITFVLFFLCFKRFIIFSHVSLIVGYVSSSFYSFVLLFWIKVFLEVSF